MLYLWNSHFQQKSSELERTWNFATELQSLMLRAQPNGVILKAVGQLRPGLRLVPSLHLMECKKVAHIAN